MKKRLGIYIMVSLSFLLTLAAIFSGFYFRAGDDTYDLVLNQPSHVTIFATREVPDAYTTEANRRAAYEFALARYHNEPIRHMDPTVWLAVERSIEARFNEIHEIRDFYRVETELIAEERRLWEIWYAEQQHQTQVSQANWDLVYETLTNDGTDTTYLPPRPPDFVPQPGEEWVDPALLAPQAFDVMPNVGFTEAQRQHLLYMPEEALEFLWEITWAAANHVQTGSIREWELPGEREDVSGAIARHLENLTADADRILYDIAFHIVNRHVQPNHLIDQNANEHRRAEDENNYETVTLPEGLMIIQEGHLVTEREIRILEYLGYIGGERDPRAILRDALFPLLGMLALTMALFAASIMYIYYYRPTIVTTQKEAALLFILYMLVLVLIWVLREQPYAFLPILIFPMLVSMLIDRRCAIALNLSVVLVGYFIIDATPGFLLFYTIAGALVCLLSRYTTQRSKIILVGFLVTAIAFSLKLAIAFALERHLVLADMQLHLINASFAGLNGLLVVIVSVGSLPFWEALFGVVTPIKLLDLTNPTNLLLRRLTIEAPGTYHHSLMVANLAESAAYDIDANAHAARVGGYYHDVGKLKYPHFFSENISGENPHDHLEPISSANLLVSHVTYGLTLAAQHRLPQFVRDIIREHHGTSLMQFFFHKARKIDPAVEEDEYRYPYDIPQTRESACVMLADTVEAAVRAMMPKIKSLEEVDKTIQKLVRDKLNDGQLADSQLSIKDLEIIEKSFARVLKSAHHERIAYPKLEPKTETLDPRDPPLLIRGLVKKE